MKPVKFHLFKAALWLMVGIMLGVAIMVIGCGGEIDPGRTVSIRSASETWTVEKRFP